MEKRKLLLVAVSVGVFLVIVLSAAILIFTPSAGGLAPLEGGSQSALADAGGNQRRPASADTADMVRNSGDLQGLRVAPPGATPGAVPVSGTEPAAGSSASAVQENNFYINGEAASSTAGGDSPQVVINVPQPSAPGVPSPPVAAPARSGQARIPPASAARPAAAPVATATAPSSPARPAAAAASSPPARPAAPSTAQPGAARPAAAATAAPGPAVRPAAAAVSSPAARPTASTVQPAARAAPRSQQDYWIQTGAFSALVRAEGAKETLAAKGLSSIIDDREVDGQTWYRVRVGPYTSENEANYWLSLVRAIDGFDQSQVRSAQR